MYVPSRILREQLHDALEKANEIVMKIKRTLWSSILFLIALNFWLNYQYRQPHHHTFQFLWNNNCKTRPAIQISVFFTPPLPQRSKYQWQNSGDIIFVYNFVHNSFMWWVVVGRSVIHHHPSTNHNLSCGRVVHKVVHIVVVLEPLISMFQFSAFPFAKQALCNLWKDIEFVGKPFFFFFRKLDWN